MNDTEQVTWRCACEPPNDVKVGPGFCGICGRFPTAWSNPDDSAQAPESTHALPERLQVWGAFGEAPEWHAEVLTGKDGEKGSEPFAEVFSEISREDARAKATELVRRWNADADVRELVEAIRRLEKSGLEGQCPVCRAHRHWDDCYVDALLKKHGHVNTGGALRNLMDRQELCDAEGT